MQGPEPSDRAAPDFTDLLAAARVGSRAALGQLLERHRRHLRLQGRRQLPTELHAELDSSDAVQETLCRATAHFSEFHGTTEAALVAWMRRILHNYVSQLCRAHTARFRDLPHLDRELEGAEEWPEQPDPAQRPPDDIVSLHEEEDRVLGAFQNLYPRRLRLILRLHVRDGLPLTEVARQLGRSHEAVRHDWRFALAKLKEMLETRGMSFKLL